MLALACNLSAYGKEPEKPSMAFLEYLAELEQVQGQWVSPLDMQPQEKPDNQSDQQAEKKVSGDNTTSEQQQQEVKK